MDCKDQESLDPKEVSSWNKLFDLAGCDAFDGQVLNFGPDDSLS